MTHKKAGSTAKSDLKAALPAHVPCTPVKPDIASVAGGDDAVTDTGFLRYPVEQVATVSGAPGKGGKYAAVTSLWGTVPTPPACSPAPSRARPRKDAGTPSW